MTETPTPQPRALTLSEVRAAAKEIVSERPNHSMSGERCMYRDPFDGSPVCLVGAIFHKLDPDLFARFSIGYADADLPPLGNHSTLASIDRGANLSGNWEPGVLTYLDRLQSMQDSGSTWINAFESAELALQTLNGEHA